MSNGMSHSTVLTQPWQIECYRLVALRVRLKLENIGMRSSGPALRPRIAAELGLKPRDSRDVFIAEITKRVEALKAANMRPETTEETAA